MATKRQISRVFLKYELDVSQSRGGDISIPLESGHAVLAVWPAEYDRKMLHDFWV